MTRESDFSAAERAALYRVIGARRDVRSHFSTATIPDDVLMRVLGAAHAAPSVGFSQPWRFIIIRDPASRAAAHAAFQRANVIAARRYSDEKAQRYAELRLQGILDAPLNLCVLSVEAPQRGHGLGRQTMPETARYSTVCAIENLWLAARAEGLGVGWVSIIDPDEIRALFGVPSELALIAYLCVGYVDGFAETPDLERARWEDRVPLDDVLCYERYAEPERIP